MNSRNCLSEKDLRGVLEVGVHAEEEVAAGAVEAGDDGGGEAALRGAHHNRHIVPAPRQLLNLLLRSEEPQLPFNSET